MPGIFESASRDLRDEVQRRTRVTGFEPGGWFRAGELLLATARTLLAVRVRGEGRSCHWLDGRERSPAWRVAVPMIDLASRRVSEVSRDAARVIEVPQRPMARVRRRRRAPDPLQLSLPFTHEEALIRRERETSIAHFIADIPARQRDRIRPAPARWHWQLLTLLDEVGDPAEELLASTPALALGVAIAPLFAAKPAPSLAELVSWRQRRIAGFLGFPETRSAVRALRKIPLGELDAMSLLILRRLLENDEVSNRIAHLPRLSASLLRVANTPERFMALERESQLSMLDTRVGPPVARELEDALGQLLCARRRGFRLPGAIRSRMHAATVSVAIEQLIAEVGPHEAHDRLPAAPFPGIPGRIEPLRCVGDLHDEGVAQHNCVRALVRYAIAGELALYRITRPERATLSLVKSDAGWHLGELWALGNRPVAAETEDAIEHWLSIWGIVNESPSMDPVDEWGEFEAEPDDAGDVPF